MFASFTELFAYFLVPASKSFEDHVEPLSLYSEKEIAFDYLEKPAEPTTLLALLQRAATLWPEHGITFVDGNLDTPADSLTYADLWREATTNGAKLRASGTVEPQQPVITYFNTHRSNVIWYWSVIAAGGVPALLSPLSSNETTRVGELGNVSRLFGHPTVLTARKLRTSFPPNSEMNVLTVETLLAEAHEIGLLPLQDAALDHVDEVGTILFTSGSTGFAKGVEYTHTQLICSSKLKSDFHAMDSSKTFLSWVSFDHSAALCENHLHALYAGASQVMVPAIDFVTQPNRFWKALSDHQISYTFAPNFFIAAATRAMDGLTAEERNKLDFSALRVIMCGGEANKTATIEAAELILVKHGAPPCSIKASYGLSETCSALFYNVESPRYDVEREYLFASAGKHLPRHELRIVDENNQKVAQTQSGAIQVRGPLVFKRYYNNPVATEACTTSDGWFDTGDLGSLDDAGNLLIVGRSKEVLIINGQNYSSFELEHAIESSNIDGLTKSFTASFSIWADGDSEDIVILFNPVDNACEDSQHLRDTVASINNAVFRFCRKKPHTVVPLPKHKLPKSTIGKLSRAKLKKSYQAGDFDSFKLSEIIEQPDEIRGPALSTPLQLVLSKLICQTSGVTPDRLHLDLAMADLQMDSLAYLRFKSTLEKELQCEEPLSLSMLLTCRTIRDVDHMLLTLGKTTVEYDPIVPLVQAGSKTPLILCHPGGGEFLTWMGLLKYLPDRPICALRARGFHRDEAPFATFEEMLDEYEAAIRRHQPQGPYALLGLCFGGMLAFELGKRLEATGDTVSFCGGIDTLAQLSQLPMREKPRNFLIDLLHFYQLLDYDTALRWEHELDHIPDDAFMEAVYARLPDGAFEKLDLTPAKIEAWQRINKTMQDFTRAYLPTGTVSCYDVFWVSALAQCKCTDDEWRFGKGWLGQWREHVAGASQRDVDHDASDGPLRYHRVVGTHFTILRPENIDIFQVALNAALKARGI